MPPVDAPLSAAALAQSTCSSSRANPILKHTQEVQHFFSPLLSLNPTPLDFAHDRNYAKSLQSEAPVASTPRGAQFRSAPRARVHVSSLVDPSLVVLPVGLARCAIVGSYVYSDLGALLLATFLKIPLIPAGAVELTHVAEARREMLLVDSRSQAWAQMDIEGKLEIAKRCASELSTISFDDWGDAATLCMRVDPSKSEAECGPSIPRPRLLFASRVFMLGSVFQ